MVDLFWRLVVRWAVPRCSYDAVTLGMHVATEQATEALAALRRARLDYARFQGKVAIGPEYHKKVAALLSTACQLVDRPTDRNLAAQLLKAAVDLQGSEVVIATDGSMNG